MDRRIKTAKLKKMENKRQPKGEPRAPQRRADSTTKGEPRAPQRRA